MRIHQLPGWAISALTKRILATLSVLTGRSIAVNKKITAYHVQTYSQEGEDSVLSRLIGSQQTGFYVDIGAHHPQRYSNTYLFYLRGWKGIAIEPNPLSAKLFKEIRPKDINVEIGISLQEGKLDYFEFEEPALNTFDEDIAKSIKTSKFLRSRTISVVPLHKVLNKYLPEGQHIDFMSIDVEGLDEQVARSNDWEKFRPKFLLIESRKIEKIEEVIETSLHQYMKSIRYHLIAKCVNTLIYKTS